jgi:protein gp37
MAEETKIAWCDSTFSPWIGCTKIGPGCDNCYAAAGDHRFTGGAHWGASAPRRVTSEAYWRKPLQWDKKANVAGVPWRVFCASQADVFDNEADTAVRASLFELIKLTPNLTWLLLTKRVGNVKAMLPPDWGIGYPNVWLGITVVTQEEAERDIRKLEHIPARVRWLSIEPQLERIFMGALMQHINWVVCGGESAQFGKCRKFDVDWARELMYDTHSWEQPFFMKQLGSRAVDRGQSIAYTGKGDDPAEWPEEIRIREFPA